jgi:hypothetical protein
MVLKIECFMMMDIVLRSVFKDRLMIFQPGSELP